MEVVSDSRGCLCVLFMLHVLTWAYRWFTPYYFLYALPDLCRLTSKYIFHLEGSVVTMVIDEKEILQGIIIIIFILEENKMVKKWRSIDIVECFQG